MAKQSGTIRGGRKQPNWLTMSTDEKIKYAQENTKYSAKSNTYNFDALNSQMASAGIVTSRLSDDKNTSFKYKDVTFTYVPKDNDTGHILLNGEYTSYSTITKLDAVNLMRNYIYRRYGNPMYTLNQ